MGRRHLSNNGVEESPPSRSSHFNLSNSKHGPDPSEIFINLENCNVGFKHFHPIPVTQNGSRLSGQAEMGGAWEWTSSVLEKHTGFEAMEVYPGYTGQSKVEALTLVRCLLRYAKRTFLTENTTLSWADPGQHTRDLLVVRLCMLTPPKSLKGILWNIA